MAASILAGAAPFPASELVNTEAAFGRAVSEKGFRDGFLAFAAQDAVVFHPAPVPARAWLTSLPATPGAGSDLRWWPARAGIARSGDLGFTIGGATNSNLYLTIWQRQSDETWKWIFDGGVAVPAVPAEGRDGSVKYSPQADARRIDATTAAAQVRRLEAEAGSASAGGTAAWLRHHLGADACLMSAGGTSCGDGAGPNAEIARRPAVVTTGETAITSTAGDLVFTTGTAALRVEESGAKQARYARVWRHDTHGWHIAVDMLFPAY